MSKFNKTYRIRTEVGKDTQVHVNLDRDYDILEIMSLSIDQKNAYKFHTSNYGVIAGRVLANGAFGIPNAKVSVFIKINDKDIMDSVKSVLYPYNTTQSTNNDGIKYNLLPDEQLNDCHTIIGTFPEKQYILDNNNILEIFENYYKFTTRTNNAGDYMIFGVPTGNQTIHVDIDLSDIGILSQKPRDMVYKGYNIESFENPNKFKHDTSLQSLVQVISQDVSTEVIPFWGEETESSIGITRCDIEIEYKFEPTCVFMGSVVSDTDSNGVSKKCIPTPKMGSMEDIVTGSGRIEMIRKTPSGGVEEFQIKGNELISGDGVWCYQIPMNLDYMMTDEFGNMVPTNHPEKGIPTRTRVRFRLSLDAFENDDMNMGRGKMLIPHNPNVYSSECQDEIDYQFGDKTKELSYRDLFWNGVYSVKSYIPRLQKGSSDKDESFTGFKRVNYHGDKNPIPYNNIRIKIPYMFTVMCTLIKSFLRVCKFLNKCFRLVGASFVSISSEDGKLKSGSFITLSGELCNNNLDWLCVVPGLDISKVVDQHKKVNGKYVTQDSKGEWKIPVGTNKKRLKTLLATSLLNHYEEMGGDISPLTNDDWDGENKTIIDNKSIDTQNYYDPIDYSDEEFADLLSLDVTEIKGSGKSSKKKDKILVKWGGLKVTDDMDYLIKCIEMNLAKEYKVIQFDFYNDWINGLIYIPRWMRNITKKTTYSINNLLINDKIEACNESQGYNINLVQQCALTYHNDTENGLMQIFNNPGCNSTTEIEKSKGYSNKLKCHTHQSVRKAYRTFLNSGLVHQIETIKKQYLYYFKPVDCGNEKNIRLFATDIILLGTLNACDRWGIPSDFKNLTSTSYQMPTNLALTDSALEGEDYEARYLGDSVYLDNSDGKNTIERKSYTLEALMLKKNLITQELYLRDAYTSINPIEEDANYTEMAGISWNFTGPLQSIKNSDSDRSSYLYRLYNPGGHFLGLSCRNSETNIKTCVNLSRICEQGVWMSQRQKLNIPDTNSTGNTSFKNYATVPSGLISKDEISDTNYRRLFASMNKNRLKTRINPETGYPIYDFEYVNPTNFAGELSNHLDKTLFNKNNFAYNRTVGTVKSEKNYDYDDYEKYILTNKETIDITPETEIMRTGEFLDIEYLKYRFGLKDSDINYENNKPYIKTEVFDKRFLVYDLEKNRMSFPIYDNSFYFYFGLKDGNTAIDEFKKTYYANCDKASFFSVTKNDIELLGLKIENDGFKNIQDENGNIIESKGSGYISFTDISTTDEMFLDKNTHLKLYKIDNDEEELIKTFILSGNYENDLGNNIEYITKQDIRTNKKLIFNNLKNGEYKLIIENKTINIHIEKYYTINNVSIDIPIQGFNFHTDVSKEKMYNKFKINDDMDTSEDLYKYREDYGGYIILSDDCIKYHISKNESPKDINLYNDYEIYKYKVIGTYNDSKGNIVNIEIESITDNQTDYRYEVSTMINGEKVSVPLTQDTVPPYRHMIPVPQENATYYLEIYGKVNNSYKLDEKGEKICLIGKSEPVYIGNGTVMEIYYNDVPYSTEIEPHLTDVEKELDADYNNFGSDSLKYLITGWWNRQYEGNDKAAWEDDDVHQDIMWKMKEALYMSHINDKTKPHKINIKVTGGIPPYDEILLGSNNAGESLRIWDYSTSNPVQVNNLFELTNIQVPSLNYYYKGHKRRSNFIYWAEDYYNNYVGGNNGFVFPIIYKPFFTEMLLCNYSKKGVYLCGNVYNGKTWLNSLNEYEFNVFSFNGQNLGSISTNISDTKFQLNEITDNGETVTGEGVCDSWTNEKAKEYCKYNGRKITVIRPLTTLDVYNVFINNNYLNGSLKIGTNLKYEENDYIDEISISNNSLALFNFDTDYKIENNELQIRKIINSSNANVYIVKDKDYPYPMNEYGEPTITNTKLFRNIVNNSINSLSYDKNEYIDLSKFDDDSNLYWIALPDRKGDIITSINDNILKSVTISELVNVKELKSFYPLDLSKNTCTTILKSNGTYETKMELRCEDTISKSNMSGKEFTITFYKEESGKNKIHEITLTPNSSMISYKFTTNDRELLGIENNDKEKVLYFNYNTKIIKNNTVCPIPYGMRKMVVKFEIEEEI